MEIKIYISQSAITNIENSINYAEDVLGAFAFARSLTNEFSQFLRNVASFPEMYPLMQDEKLRAKNYRRALIKSYVAIYEYNGKEIFIHGFFHQSQDYARFL